MLIVRRSQRTSPQPQRGEMGERLARRVAALSTERSSQPISPRWGWGEFLWDRRAINIVPLRGWLPWRSRSRRTDIPLRTAEN